MLINACVRLADDGQVEIAFRIFDALIRLRKREGEREAEPHFRGYEFEQVLKKCSPALAAVDGNRTVALIAKCLHRAIEIERRDGETNDYSHIWRSAIEEHFQNMDSLLKGKVVAALRDIGEQLLNSRSTNVSSLRRLMPAESIFDRLELHWLQEHGTREEGVAALLDEEKLQDIALRHEYTRLLEGRFTSLNEGQQAELLEFIDRGPASEADSYVATLEEAGDRDTLAAYTDRWRLERFALVRDHLPTHFVDRLNTLEKSQGQAKGIGFAIERSAMWHGPTSPLSADELLQMSDEDLLKFLATWKPPEGHFVDSIGGLSRALSEATQKAPGRISRLAPDILTGRRELASSVLTGIRAALPSEEPIAWDPLVEVCMRLLEDTSPSVRSAVADLAWEGLAPDKAGSIPDGEQERVWAIVAQLARDEDPADEREEKSLAGGMDAATLSLNTVRGRALHSVIRYIAWRQQADPKITSLADVPEAKQLLEERLNLEVEPAVSVHCVYGWWLGWLCYFDSPWVEQHLDEIFPVQEAIRRATWQAFLQFSQPYAPTVPILTDQYAWAIEQLGSWNKSDADERLAAHLTVYYWEGKIPGPADAGLLKELFERASEGTRGHVIDFIGRSLYQTEDEIPAAVMTRLRALLQQRLENVTDSQELQGFGWWFATPHLDNDWKLEKLMCVLSTLKRAPDTEHWILEELVELSSEFPKEAVEALVALVDLDTDPWAQWARRKESASVLSNAIGAGGEPADVAEELIHKLGAKGIHDYRSLLPSH